jgi:hypothetical protein
VGLDADEGDFSLVLVELSLFLDSDLESEVDFELFSSFEAPLLLRA